MSLTINTEFACKNPNIKNNSIVKAATKHGADINQVAHSHKVTPQHITGLLYDRGFSRLQRGSIFNALLGGNQLRS